MTKAEALAMRYDALATCEGIPEVKTLLGTKMKQAKHSFLDTKGHPWVACSECDRGGNGTDKDRCSCGWNVKRWNRGGCFSGRLLEGLAFLTSQAEDE